MLRWKLILLLSLAGVLSGVASLFGISFAEPFFLLVVVFGYAWIIAGWAPGRYFLHGFLVGVLFSVWLTLIHAYYIFGMAGAGIVEVEPLGLKPQTMNVIQGAFMALVAGALTGCFSMIAARMLRRKPEAEA